MSAPVQICPKCREWTARELARAVDDGPMLVTLKCARPECGYTEFLRSEPAPPVMWPFRPLPSINRVPR